MLLSNRAMRGSNPEKMYSFTNAATTDWSYYTSKGNWRKAGMVRNFHCGDANASGLTNKASQPSGNIHPVAYVMAQKPGRVSSHKICFIGTGGTAKASIGSLISTKACSISFGGGATGTLILGLRIDGTAGIVIDDSAVGQMTLKGAGAATITIASNGAILGNVPAAGSAAITLGAIADIVAQGWLRGNGQIALDGTLQSYAVGILQGSTEDKSTLTAANLAAAVWEALAAAYNTPGSMGAKLNSASAAGDPWGAPLPGSYVHGEAGYIIGTILDKKVSDVSGSVWSELIEEGYTAEEILRVVAAALAGKLSGAGTPLIKIRNLDDTKDVVTAVTDANGNRITVDLDP